MYYNTTIEIDHFGDFDKNINKVELADNDEVDHLLRHGDVLIFLLKRNQIWFTTSKYQESIKYTIKAKKINNKN